jgi:hypothetical protein
MKAARVLYAFRGHTNISDVLTQENNEKKIYFCLPNMDEVNSGGRGICIDLRNARIDGMKLE